MNFRITKFSIRKAKRAVINSAKIEGYSLPKLGLISLGCAKNFADLEAVVAGLNDVVLTDVNESEIVLLNTCGFLKSARDEVFANLRELADKKVVILGCLAGKFLQKDFKKYPQIYAVVTSANYKKISSVVEKVAKGEKVFLVANEPSVFERANGKILLGPKSYAYIKIAEGCNNRCSYCLIPYLKGRYRSRPMEDVLAEAHSVLARGVKEIILVAQDCGFYNGGKLPELLRRLVKIKGDFWVRVLYVYPERVSRELLSVMADSDKIYKYLDMPLQHGDSRILKAMGRPNDLKKIFAKINLIREMVPGITLRTSLIVGFPGESVSAFENLKNFVRKIDFDHVGVFEYSREKGTPAYLLGGQVAKRVKKARRDEIMAIQQKISLGKNRELVGRVVRVLIDRPGVGRSERFAPDVDGEIRVRGGKIGEFAMVKITGATEYNLSGHIV